MKGGDATCRTKLCTNCYPTYNTNNHLHMHKKHTCKLIYNAPWSNPHDISSCLLRW